MSAWGSSPLPLPGLEKCLSLSDTLRVSCLKAELLRSDALQSGELWASSVSHHRLLDKHHMHTDGVISQHLAPGLQSGRRGPMLAYLYSFLNTKNNAFDNCDGFYKFSKEIATKILHVPHILEVCS